MQGYHDDDDDSNDGHGVRVVKNSDYKNTDVVFPVTAATRAGERFFEEVEEFKDRDGVDHIIGCEMCGWAFPFSSVVDGVDKVRAGEGYCSSCGRPERMAYDVDGDRGIWDGKQTVASVLYLAGHDSVVELTGTNGQTFKVYQMTVERTANHETCSWEMLIHGQVVEGSPSRLSTDRVEIVINSDASFRPYIREVTGGETVDIAGVTVHDASPDHKPTEARDGPERYVLYEDGDVEIARLKSGGYSLTQDHMRVLFSDVRNSVLETRFDLVGDTGGIVAVLSKDDARMTATAVECLEKIKSGDDV